MVTVYLPSAFDQWRRSLMACCLLAEMSRFSFDNNNFPYDNNVLVLDMVLGSLWGVNQPINWENVAKLVPGFTPKEVTQMFSTNILPTSKHTVCDCNVPVCPSL